jgi:hypothetical protein
VSEPQKSKRGWRDRLRERKQERKQRAADRAYRLRGPSARTGQAISTAPAPPADGGPSTETPGSPSM